MTDDLSNLFVALNKRAALKIAGVSRKNKREDAKHVPATHSEMFDVKFKNHPGSHDEQTHTTLFNLANPSQGREGSNRNKTDEVRASATDAPSKSLGEIPALSELSPAKTYLGGSTGASLMTDKDGNQYVVKTGNSPEHVISESIAYDLYRAAGVPVPQTKLEITETGPVLISRFVEGKLLRDLEGKELDSAITKINKHFAVDALLGNWDAIGSGRDNIIVGKDGVPYRIDVGGSLTFKAEGAAKTFGGKVPEVTLLRKRSDGDEEMYQEIKYEGHRDATQIFGQLSDKQVAQQILGLGKPPQERHKLHGMPDQSETPALRILQAARTIPYALRGQVFPSDDLYQILSDRVRDMTAQAHGKTLVNSLKEYDASGGWIPSHMPPPNTPPSPRGALNEYVDMGFKQVNADIRNRIADKDMTPKDLQIKTGLDTLMASKVAIPIPGILFRGVKDTTAAAMGYRVGKEETDRAFVSTTKDSGLAKSWAYMNQQPDGGKQGVVFVIIANPKLGIKGLDVSLLQGINPQNGREQEIILPRGLSAVVTKIKVGALGKKGAENPYNEPDRVYLRIISTPDTSAAGDSTTTKNYKGRKTLIVAFKNHPGSHDEQTHTTLYNLANPSQGREGGKGKGSKTELASVAPIMPDMGPKNSIYAKAQMANMASMGYSDWGDLSAPDSAAPVTPAASSAIPYLDELTETGTTLGGSTGAKLMVDKDGNRYVVKRGASPEHIASEAMTYDLYRAAGVPVPQTSFQETLSGPVLVSRFIEGRTLGSLRGKELDDAITKINKHFVVDALLGNWDAIGMGRDNIIIGKNGVPYRIDVGGSLVFRAQGALKPFTTQAGEIDTLRTSRDGAPIFGKLSDKQVADQIMALHQRASARLKAHEDPPANADESTKAEKMFSVADRLRLNYIERMDQIKNAIDKTNPEGERRTLDNLIANRLNNLTLWAHQIKNKDDDFGAAYKDYLREGQSDRKVAFTEYIGDRYAEVNDALRDRNLSDLSDFGKRVLRGMEDMMASQLTTALPPVLYRGVGGKSADSLGLKVGQTNTDLGYGSTSTRRAFTKEWAFRTTKGYEDQEDRIPKDAHGVHFIIVADPRRGFKGLDVQFIKERKVQNMNEAEFILPRGTVTKVMKIVKGGWGDPKIHDKTEPDRVYLRIISTPLPSEDGDSTTTKNYRGANTLIMAFKNYPGSHMEETHTTLYNLAHPSQIRDGGKTRETFAKEGGSEAGFAALYAATTKITAEKWLAQHIASISTQQLWQQEISKMVIGVSEEISAKGITAVEHASNLYALHNKLDYSTQRGGNLVAFGANANDQLANWSRTQLEIKTALQGAGKLVKQFPDNADYKNLYSQVRNRYIAFAAAQRLMMRESEEHANAANKLPEFIRHQYTKTGVERVNWDGATDAPASRDGVVAARGIKEKSIAEGASTVKEVSRIAKEMGVPSEFLKFATSQTGVGRTTLAQYDPETNNITIFPHLVNGKNNTNVQLRAVLTHEVAHHQYAAISLAVKYSNAPTSPNSMRTVQVGVTFGSKVLGDLKTKDFLGTSYERKLLQAFTNPKSSMNIDAKTGTVTAKKGFEPFVALFKADGVSAYSAKYWREFSVFPSQQALRKAINETLSEVAYLKTAGQAKTIQKGWLAASQLFESLYGKLGSPYVGFDLDAGYKELGSANPVTYKKTQVFEALKEVSARYTLPAPPKYTSKSMQKLVGKTGWIIPLLFVGQHGKSENAPKINDAHDTYGSEVGNAPNNKHLQKYTSKALQNLLGQDVLYSSILISQALKQRKTGAASPRNVASINNYTDGHTLITAFKNHPGSHDEQTHTTLFNLANPSQGREGSNRNKTGAAPEKAYISINPSDYMSAKTPAKVKPSAPAAAPAPAAAAPIKQVSTGVMPSLFSQLTETGTTLGGSTGAKLMVDKDGNRYVVKRGASPEHIASEGLAYSLYRAAGVPVPQTTLLASEDGPVLVSRFIEGRPLGSLRGKELDDAITKINKHFVVDALLGNWDAVGLGRDNIIVGKDGVPYRIDVGGSLAFRAQGGAKDFGFKVGEIDTLRTSKDGAPIFGKLSDKQVGEQILALHNRPAMRAIAHTDPSGLMEPNTRAEFIYKMGKNSYVGDALVARLHNLITQAHDMLQAKSFSQPYKELYANKSGIKYESLQNYTHDSTAVNQYLRRGDSIESYATGTGRTLEGIDRLMASGLATRLPPVLYRGVAGSSASKLGYKVGDTVTDKSFGSTTTKRGFAKSWATTMIGGVSSGTATTGRSSAPADAQGVVFTIISPPKLKATGLDVQLLQKQKHYSTGEAEHITPRGMVYKVVKIVKGSWGTPGQDTHTEPDRVYLRLVKLPDTSAAGDGTTTKNYRGRKTLIMAFKNHPGSHDEQTHTTLFNLANPSQGREGSKRNKTDEVRASATDAPSKSLGEIPRLSQLTETGTTLGGSTGASLMLDKDGNRYVVKRGASPEHIASEAATYDLYRAAGVPVPQTSYQTYRDGPVLISRFIEGRPLGSLSGKELDDAITKINKHFVVDALLANWDTVGMSRDNIIIGKDGVPYRIDVGGSLAYRAQGGTKEFGDKVGEIDTLRTSRDGAPIFGKLSDKQVADQILALHNRPAMRLTEHANPISREYSDVDQSSKAEKLFLAAERLPSNISERIEQTQYALANSIVNRLENLTLWAHQIKNGDGNFGAAYKSYLGAPDTDTRVVGFRSYIGAESGMVNKSLRTKTTDFMGEGDKQKTQRIVRGMDELVASLSTALPPVLYRGVRESSADSLGLKVGQTNTDLAYGSTSASRQFTKGWASRAIKGFGISEDTITKDKQGVHFIIVGNPKRGFKGLDVQFLKERKVQHMNEAEFILPRGTVTKVMKIVKGSWGDPKIHENTEPDRVYLRIVSTPLSPEEGGSTTTKSYRGRKTLTMAFKNHPGSHDEQTHTTLFNLANPSQGREGGKQNKTEPLKATAAPEAASVAPTPINKVSTSEMPRLFSRLTETGVTLGGSSGAKLMVDQDGNRYVVKRGNSETTEARMRAEAVAYDLYRAAGVPVPQTVVLETDTGPVLVSRFIEGRPLSSLSGKELDDATTKINKHFVVDALLANWDAIGASRNNIIVGKDGVPYRIDVSSSLALKSQDGSIKPFSLRLEEMDTLRKSKDGASIYGKLSDEQVAEQILALHNRPAMRTIAHKRPWNDDEPLTRAEKMMKAGRNSSVTNELTYRSNNLLVWAQDKLQAQSFSKPYRVFGLPDTDTIKQAEALNDYVVNSYALNNYLRGKDTAPSYALVMKDGLDKLMASPLATRLPPVLYRGVPGSSADKLGYKVGDTVKDSAFGSTTTKRGFAKAWATSTVGALERSVPPDAQGVVFTIISPPKLKATGLDVQLLQKRKISISPSPSDEGEHITPRGMAYKVVKIVKGSWGRPGQDTHTEPDRVYLRLVSLPDPSAAD